MKTYTLKLKTTSTTNYNLYDGTTIVSDTDLSTLFGSAGEAYFVFDFNSLTPTNTTSLTILDSQDTAIITNTGLSGIAEDKNFKGTWSASATTFDSFTLLTGVAMDEAQLSKLAGLSKDGKIRTLTSADYDWPVNNPTGIALWRLPKGIFYIQSGTKYRISRSYGETIADGDRIYIIDVDSEGRRHILRPFNTGWADTTVTDLGGFAVRQLNDTQYLLKAEDVKDNLTTASVINPLSAKQGKVLKDLIDALDARVTLLEGGSN